MRSFLAGIVLVVALIAAGCGGGGSPTTTASSSGDNGMASKSPSEVLKATTKAAESASSLHMTGNVTTSGKKIELDLKIAKDKGAVGSISLNGKKVDLVVVGKNGYLKADSAFWNQFAGSSGAMIAQLLAGRWLKFPVDNAQFQPLVAFSSPNAFFDSLKSGADSALKNDGKTTYKGQSVVALNDGEEGTLYVAATGTPYPVALAKTGSESGSIEFSDWNAAVSVSAPENVLDFSHLTG